MVARNRAGATGEGGGEEEEGTPPSGNIEYHDVSSIRWRVLRRGDKATTK